MIKFKGEVMEKEKTYKEWIQEGKQYRGKKELLKHLDDGILSARQALLAKCYDCTGSYDGGTEDCEIPDCPLHPFMPYRKGGVRKGTRKGNPNLGKKRVKE
jgi:hypothetical protein